MTFQEYLEQHDGQNEFTNRRREQVLADRRRESASYLARIEQETVAHIEDELALPMAMCTSLRHNQA